MEKDRHLWKFRLRVKSHVIPFQHHEESTKEASTSENLRSAFNFLAARIESATDIELLKTIFD